jgi:hypothetical protein
MNLKNEDKLESFVVRSEVGCIDLQMDYQKRCTVINQGT